MKLGGKYAALPKLQAKPTRGVALATSRKPLYPRQIRNSLREPRSNQSAAPWGRVGAGAAACGLVPRPIPSEFPPQFDPNQIPLPANPIRFAHNPKTETHHGSHPT